MNNFGVTFTKRSGLEHIYESGLDFYFASSSEFKNKMVRFSVLNPLDVYSLEDIIDSEDKIIKIFVTINGSPLKVIDSSNMTEDYQLRISIDSITEVLEFIQEV